MHNRAALLLGIGLLALCAWAALEARAWPLKTALFPLAIAVPLFCLAAAEVVWGVLEGLGKAGAGAKREEVRDFQLATHLPKAVALRRTGLAIGWILGFFAAIVLLGFPYAVPLFVFAFLKLQGREGWLFSAAFAGALWALFYGLFERLLHLPFASGLLF